MMPAIFLGHGNPMNAISTNTYTEAWAAIGREFPRPEAVLMVSAHWYIERCAVTISPAPRTIHDFGGFPDELYKVNYPAPGSPELARHVRDILSPQPVELDSGWGLDHGAWSVLKHVYPKADVPVVQLSVDYTQPPDFHYALGKRLGRLRKERVLVIGSGNIVHNLFTYAWGERAKCAFDWATRFERHARELMLARREAELVDYEALGRDAMLSIPTPDHYLPLLYVLGMRGEGDEITFPVEGVDGGSVSMLAVRVG